MWFSEEDFLELKEFINTIKFNHLGVFTYSKEEGTKASFLPDQIEDEIKNSRKEILMNDQKKISYELNKKMISRKEKAIITKVLANNEYEVRSVYNAPDDIDGSVILKTTKNHLEGDIVSIEYTNAFVYDLLAKEI